MLDTGSLPALPRAERCEVLDTWLTGLLDEAAAGTPPPRARRGGTPPRTGTDGVVHAETAYDFASLGGGGGAPTLGTQARAEARNTEGIRA